MESRTTPPATAGSQHFRNYPFLTSEEFAEACHYLERQYCQATLGPLRRLWRLRTCTALNTSLALAPEYSTYVQIVRPLDDHLDDGGLSAFLDSLSFDDRSSEADAAHDHGMEVEEQDEAVMLANPPAKPRGGYVKYEIHLHPTYQAPCLWFSLDRLPVDEKVFDLDTVFRRLVPDQYKQGLRANTAGLGGISADHHPVTGVPSFFVHPCLLGDAMSQFACSREDYLMVWLGLVGGCVGLWVPTEMALGRAEGP